MVLLFYTKKEDEVLIFQQSHKRNGKFVISRGVPHAALDLLKFQGNVSSGGKSIEIRFIAVY